MGTHQLSALLDQKSHVIIDGAMATELEKLGIDTSQQLWSAAALVNHADAIATVHQKYFDCGADVAITNTYQANISAFMAEGFTESQASELIKHAVHIAVEVRNNRVKTQHLSQDPTPLIVAGSIGPYGAFLADGSEYTGAYSLSEAEYRNFHQTRMELIDSAGADCFALETMPNGLEISALLSLLSEKFIHAEAWLSLSMADESHLRDGAPLADIMPLVNDSSQVVAVGVNCLSLELAERALSQLSALTDKPLLAYPNSGEEYDPRTKTWFSTPAKLSVADFVQCYIDAGAQLIGGCCRTTPSDIYAVSQQLSLR